MSALLLRRVVFAELAARGAQLEDVLEPSRFDRLAGLAQAGSGPLQVSLTLSRLAGAEALVEGHIRGHIALECQRCLESVRVPIDAAVRVGIVERGIDYARVPSGYEPFEAPDGQGRLADLVEEEVLLRLPDNPVHADLAQCGPLASRLQQYADAPQDGLAGNPFAVLARLKGKRTKGDDGDEN